MIRSILSITLGVLLGAAAIGAQATIFLLEDDNSTATIDTGSQAGMSSWTVDGENLLHQQWFWFRIGDSAAEASIDTLSIDVQGLSDTNFDGEFETFFVRYTDFELFDLEVRYSLDGGPDGSHLSDIAEQISIINIGDVALDFHFFQYSDFDLSDEDTARILNGNTVAQIGESSILSETVVTPGANLHEIALFSDTLAKLNDGFASDLNNDGGPHTGDVTWTYQWNRTIGVGSALQISKDKNIRRVPEPVSLLLVGAGLVGLAFAKRKKH